ncbi:hypothetical protein DFQ29_008121 [Apophysomyces sp. BC1021]|nr:hypothetical protein DFQ29_008121 [Apophysomyces sp. BC1021]
MVPSGGLLKFAYSLKPVIWHRVTDRFANSLNYRLEKSSGKPTAISACLPLFFAWLADMITSSVVDPDDDKWVSHTKYMKIPKRSETGDYNLIINEEIQLRRRKVTAT